MGHGLFNCLVVCLFISIKSGHLFLNCSEIESTTDNCMLLEVLEWPRDKNYDCLKSPIEQRDICFWNKQSKWLRCSMIKHRETSIKNTLTRFSISCLKTPFHYCDGWKLQFEAFLEHGRTEISSKFPLVLILFLWEMLGEGWYKCRWHQWSMPWRRVEKVVLLYTKSASCFLHCFKLSFSFVTPCSPIELVKSFGP